MLVSYNEYRKSSHGGVLKEYSQGALWLTAVLRRETFMDYMEGTILVVR